MTDWRSRIAELVRWKQMIAEADTIGAFPWHLPRVAASDAQLARAEAAHGPFTEDYRAFLRHADGWPGFMVSTDLFGTPELTGEKPRQVLERDDVRDTLDGAGLDRSRVAVIGATDVDTDVFVLVRSGSEVLASGVLWIAGEEIDRYANFTEFFDAMIAYNARLAQQLASKIAD